LAAPESRFGAADRESGFRVGWGTWAGVGMLSAESDRRVRPTRVVRGGSSSDEAKSAGMPVAFSAEESIH